jgi:hypothetical protein
MCHSRLIYILFCVFSKWDLSLRKHELLGGESFVQQKFCYTRARKFRAKKIVQQDMFTQIQAMPFKDESSPCNVMNLTPSTNIYIYAPKLSNLNRSLLLCWPS